MIYLDNAATTFPKPSCVIKDLNFCLKKYCGNPGRSSHALSIKSSEAIYETREEIASLLSVDTPEQIVFTYNATYALNLAIKTFVTEKCHILTGDFEHNAVIRPLERLKRELGVEYSVFSTVGNTEQNIQSAIRDDTAGIICSLSSNVVGRKLDISLLSSVAKRNGLFLIIDASQSIGHIDIDLNKSQCDVLCAPGHKALFGIQGCGFAYFRDNKRKNSFIEGGSGFDSINPEMPQLLPEAYEAGTLSTPAIVSLCSGIRFIKKTGIDNITKKLSYLTEEMADRLDSIKGIRLYDRGCGILPFNLKDIPSSMVSLLLDKHGICVRGGLHCAPSIHRVLGTLDEGIVRISLSYMNTKRQIDKVYLALREIASTI